MPTWPGTNVLYWARAKPIWLLSWRWIFFWYSMTASFTTRQDSVSETRQHLFKQWHDCCEKLTVWFSCKHAFAWGIVGTDIDYSEDASRTQQSTSFLEDALTALLGCLVESIHDGNKIERSILKGRMLGIPLLETCCRAHRLSLLLYITAVESQCVKQSLEETDMIANELGHGDHFWRRINANNLLCIGKAFNKGTSRKSNATT